MIHKEETETDEPTTQSIDETGMQALINSNVYKSKEDITSTIVPPKDEAESKEQTRDRLAREECNFLYMNSMFADPAGLLLMPGKIVPNRALDESIKIHEPANDTYTNHLNNILDKTSALQSFKEDKIYDFKYQYPLYKLGESLKIDNIKYTPSSTFVYK